MVSRMLVACYRWEMSKHNTVAKLAMSNVPIGWFVDRDRRGSDRCHRRMSKTAFPATAETDVEAEGSEVSRLGQTELIQ